jgi:signal transduction histidine kinase
MGEVLWSQAHGIFERILATGDVVITEDLANDPDLNVDEAGIVDGALAEGIDALMLLPITINGEVFGVFLVGHTHPHVFDADEQRLFTALAQRAALAIDNARRFDAEQRRAEQFRVIGEVGGEITSIMPVAETLHQVAHLVRDTFGYYHVGIGLVEGDEVVYRVGAGQLWDGPDFEFNPPRLKIGQQGLTGVVASTGRPLLVPDVRRDPRYVLMKGSQAVSELVVPIKVKGQVIGVLDVQSDRADAFDETDLKVLQALAHQTGAAIENTRLYETAQQAAVLEERGRLARELHDAVTQTLFSASLLAEVLPTTWADDPEQGRALLRDLRQLSRGALAEMRTLLLELRPSVLAEADLGDLLRQLADAVTGRTGVPVRLTMEGDCELPVDVHLAVYRIAQEALNNVVKHAQARNVSICLTCSILPGNGEAEPNAQWVELEIADDGVGFDPSRVPSDHLGLRIVAERARSVGAAVVVTSRPGQGTQLRLAWPAGSEAESGGEMAENPTGARTHA